jgi:hypothetical protein
MFICNHCPFVIHVNELVRLTNDYRVTGFGFVAISSNDVGNYKQDGPRQMQRVIKWLSSSLLTYDETQE